MRFIISPAKKMNETPDILDFQGDVYKRQADSNQAGDQKMVDFIFHFHSQTPHSSRKA